LLVWLHIQLPHVHPIRQAVSDFGASDRGALFKVHGAIGCLAAMALALTVASAGEPAFPARIAGYLLVMAAARLVVGFVPTDAEGLASTSSGRVHSLAAVVVFICAALVIIDGTRVATSAWPAQARFWQGMQWLVIVTLAGMAATRLERWKFAFGLFERAFIIASTVWYMALAASFALGA
jgi:hypothetical protein